MLGHFPRLNLYSFVFSSEDNEVGLLGTTNARRTEGKARRMDQGWTCTVP